MRGKKERKKGDEEWTLSCLKRTLQAMDTYSGLTHLSSDDRDELATLRAHLPAMEDLRCLFVLLVRPRPALPGFHWVFTTFSSLLPSFIEFYRVLPSLTEFYRVLPTFTELLFDFCRFLPSFAEFYRVLPSFTEFYRVLPSFTEFYLVLPMFI